MPLTKIHKSGAGSIATAHGDFLPIDGHGTYEVPDVLARELIESHGFLAGPGGPGATATVSAASPTSATAIRAPTFPEGSVFPSRAEMIRFLKQRRIAAPANMKNETLAALVREHVFVPPIGGAVDPAETPDRGDSDGDGGGPKGAEKPAPDDPDAAPAGATDKVEA